LGFGFLGGASGYADECQQGNDAAKEAGVFHIWLDRSLTIRLTAKSKRVLMKLLDGQITSPPTATVLPVGGLNRDVRTYFADATLSV
jgi:hypothetical protein